MMWGRVLTLLLVAAISWPRAVQGLGCDLICTEPCKPTIAMVSYNDFISQKNTKMHRFQIYLFEVKIIGPSF